MRKIERSGIAMLALSGAALFSSGLFPGAIRGATVEAGSLIDAVKAGNLAAVKKLLRQHRNPNVAETDGTTALYWGIHTKRADIVQALIAAGANVNAKNEYGITPLAWSLTTGDSGIATQLLKAGADAKVPVPEMGTALLAAAHLGDPELVAELLIAGVNVNEPEPKSKQTALMWAAAEGHEKAARVLLAAGANVKVRSSKGDTALFFAVRRGDIAVVDALLAAGADVNERAEPEAIAGAPLGGLKGSVPGDSMLSVAIFDAHFALADFLLSKNADPNMAGTRWTPLHVLSRVRDYEENQYPPPAIKAGDLDSLELAKHLLAHGANPNARAATTTAKRTPGDQNYKDLIGATPFFLAAKSGDVPYMKLLLSAGADPSIPSNDHTTPLMVAAGVGCVPGQWIEPERDVLAAVKVMVEDLHADLNAVNDKKETALNGAMCRSADSVLQYLVDKGAKLDIPDADGRTLLDKAVNGLYLAVSINSTSPLNIWRPPDHTAQLVKKLVAEHVPAQTAGVQRAVVQPTGVHRDK
jgi:ankyrin repeat protein